MRVVIDVNVLISAAISPRGNPARVLDLWEQDKFELVASPPILEELERVIHYPRIQERYNLPEEEVQQFIQLIGSATIVEPTVELSVIEKDPSDDKYLECAVTAAASHIISGDPHLLDLKEYEGVVILKPAEFVVFLGLQNRNEKP